MMFLSLRRSFQRLRGKIRFLHRLLRHPRTPWISRAFVVLTLLYLISPLDLIPDWIPILGILDDLVIVPLLLWLAIRLAPDDVVQECRQEAAPAADPAAYRR
ncbi:DUF1232 domain-containing protein [bacterium]|nr:DUF1232 domain-containing protein [bacterium]